MLEHLSLELQSVLRLKCNQKTLLSSYNSPTTSHYKMRDEFKRILIFCRIKVKLQVSPYLDFAKISS